MTALWSRILWGWPHRKNILEDSCALFGDWSMVLCARACYQGYSLILGTHYVPTNISMALTCGFREPRASCVVRWLAILLEICRIGFHRTQCLQLPGSRPWFTYPLSDILISLYPSFHRKVLQPCLWFVNVRRVSCHAKGTAHGMPFLELRLKTFTPNLHGPCIVDWPTALVSKTILDFPILSPVDSHGAGSVLSVCHGWPNLTTLCIYMQTRMDWPYWKCRFVYGLDSTPFCHLAVFSGNLREVDTIHIKMPGSHSS